MREREGRKRENVCTKERKRESVRESVSFFVKQKKEKRKTRKLRRNERV